MSTRTATARWTGTLKEGKGSMKYGAVEGPYTFASRFEEGEGTNPEELVGAAHAGCYSMFLSALLSADFKPESIETTATVTLERDDVGPKITSIALSCEAKVPGVAEDKFQELVQAAKEKCPISRLYAGTEITVSAKLLQ
jgi:osmotically inducible protein OsmC